MLKLIGIPYDSNSSFLKGPSYAPQRIRLMDKEGSANAFSESGLEIKENLNYQDCGDIAFETTNAEKAFQTINSTIKNLLKEEYMSNLITIVEDEEDILELLEYTLGTEGYETIGCVDTTNVQSILDEENIGSEVVIGRNAEKPLTLKIPLPHLSYQDYITWLMQFSRITAYY